MTTACDPTIEIDASANALASFPPSLIASMINDYGFSTTNDITSTLGFYKQVPACGYTWDVDLLYRADANVLTNDVPSTSGSYPKEI